MDDAHTPEVTTGEHTIPESGELHRLLVERVSDYAIFALDPRGHILTWNAGAERVTGYRPEEAIGKHFSIFYPPEDLAAGKPARDLQIAAKAGRVDDDEWRVRRDAPGSGPTCFSPHCATTTDT